MNTTENQAPFKASETHAHARGSRPKNWTLSKSGWHSLNTHVIAKRYPAWVCALEMQEDGVLYFHVVVVTKFDNRTGTDVATLTNYKLPWGIRRRKQYRNTALGAEWQALRETCCQYRFGRVELVPIMIKQRSNWWPWMRRC